jgi:hypothetical protein
MRSAPTGGYDFPRKRDYRRKVWATFRDTLKSRRLSVAESHALLMPSLEGDEIEVAIDAGFRESNLHVVDLEPAIVATLKRRYPRITTYGVTASRAFARLAKTGVKIRCANLDFCRKLSTPFAGELAQIALLGGIPCRVAPVADDSFRLDFDTERYGGGVFAADCCVVAVSQLRGREERVTTEEWGGLNDQTMRSEYSDALKTMQRMIDAGRVAMPPAVVQHKLLYLYRRFLELSTNDRHRVGAILCILALETVGLKKLGIPQEWKPLVQLLRTESYLSTSGQTMLWSAWEITSASHLRTICNAANAKRIAMGIRPVPYARRA